jgi:serine/threonine-protein kinase
MENGQRDIYALRPGREERGNPVIDSEFDAAGPLLSPDGRWIAFSIDEDNEPNVYVRPFPEADRQWRISPNGGLGPVWSDGEIFYRNGDDRMVAVRYQGDDTFTFGDEEVLFSTSNYRTDFYHRSYDVTPDGQRFVMIRSFEHEPGVLDVVMVENWFRELREAMASAGR